MTDALRQAREFIRRCEKVRWWPIDEGVTRAFLALPLEAKVSVLRAGYTQSVVPLTRIENPDQLLPALKAFRRAETLNRNPGGHDYCLERAAQVFRPALDRWTDHPEHAAFKRLYYEVFKNAKGAGASRALAGAVDAFEQFERSWEKLRKDPRVLISTKGMPARREFQFQGDLFLSFEPPCIQRLVYDLFGARRRSLATELLGLAGLAKAPEPPAAWIRAFNELAPRLPAPLVRRAVSELHRFHTSSEEFRKLPRGVRRVYAGPSTEAKYLAGGIVWAACRFVDDEWLDDLVRMAREHARMGDGGGLLGPYFIHAIALSGHRGAVPALQHLSSDITHKNMKKLCEKVLTKAAKTRGLTKGELEDAAAEAHGLGPSGQRSWDVGAFRVVVSLRDRGGPALAVFDRAKRKELDRPPAALARAAAFSEIRRLQARIAKAEVLQRRRLEGAMIARRTWAVGAWLESVARHPIVGNLARRLLWRVEESGRTREGFFRVEKTSVLWRDVDDRPFEIGEGATLSIPHPVELGLDEIRRVQATLLRRRIVQPFKQLYRETYVVTPAELETATYSNRFAAHIVPHRQMYALLKSRGWSGFGGFGYDGGDQGFRTFPDWSFRAEMARDQGGEEGAGLVTLSHISFSAADPGARSYSTVPLKDVPPIVFSEAMRDVDLVASVAGIGTDRQWKDWSRRLEEGKVLWQETRDRQSQMHVVPAGLRRRLLEDLLPAMNLEGRVRFEGPWAIVRGRLRTYRVHLGSGGSHLEPHGRYVCIVQRGYDRLADVFAPDDDPQTLVILSKIHLLAHDDEIKDPAILRQLE